MRSRANLPVFIAYVVIGLLATAFLAAQMGDMAQAEAAANTITPMRKIRRRP